MGGPSSDLDEPRNFARTRRTGRGSLRIRRAVLGSVLAGPCWLSRFHGAMGPCECAAQPVRPGAILEAPAAAPGFPVGGHGHVGTVNGQRGAMIPAGNRRPQNSSGAQSSNPRRGKTRAPAGEQERQSLSQAVRNERIHATSPDFSPRPGFSAFRAVANRSSPLGRTASAHPSDCTSPPGPLPKNWGRGESTGEARRGRGSSRWPLPLQFLERPAPKMRRRRQQHRPGEELSEGCGGAFGPHDILSLCRRTGQTAPRPLPGGEQRMSAAPMVKYPG